MSSSTDRPTARVFALELDVLRGIAAILMIVNHCAVHLLSASEPAAAATVAFSGLAPVVFFFATGFGLALSTAPASRPTPIAPLLWKAALLVVADQFFYWRDGVAGGLDFFSFIALATIAVTLVARARHALRLAAVLIVVLLALRFVLGPRIGVGPWLTFEAPTAF